LQYPPDFLKGKSKRLRLTNEAQLAQGRFIIGAVSRGGAAWGWQEFLFFIAGTPANIRLGSQAGSLAPDVSFIHLDSGETRRLSNFKGKQLFRSLTANGRE
jgi:hypothetical protein